MAHFLYFSLISIWFLTTSHSAVCQADKGVCKASENTKKCPNDGSSDGYASNQEPDEAYELAQSMIESLQEREGALFRSDIIEVRRQVPGDPSSPLGIFAKHDIPSNEVLIKFPDEALIRIEPSGTFEDDICILKDVLVEEMHKVDDSEFKDYIDFLLLQKATIPAAWSNQGQYLIQRMLYDRSDGIDRALPPRYVTTFYGIECFDDEEEEEQLLYLTLMNGQDTVMTPIFDIIRHSNHPDKISIKSTSVQRKHGFVVSASRSMKKGEELLHSYNQCPDCEPDMDVFGTGEIFRNHGFIEDYPQRYSLYGGHFNEEDVSFEIIMENNTLRVEWLKAPFFNGERLPSIRRQLSRLDHFRNELLIPAKTSLDKMEWDLLNDYYESLTVALSLALSDGEADKFDETYSKDSDPKEEYKLPEDTHAIELIDKFRDAIYQSETLIWATQHFKQIDTLTSQYQSIEYFKEPKTKDTCFFIDNIFQMCGSYWPYYHEMQVHKAAKYVKEDIKRVLFVGAGDNGLLNEIVKYPTLELVVGLELDQHVSRMAFKHLAGKPHFDNPKVQWWFGDASKTLFMLPKDYFGSFDMVLVDLSDTVLSLTVSGELDVVGALSLLLRPNGVFAMNELFFRRVSDVFKHTLYYQFTGIPKVLDQGFVFASNDIDLLNQELTDHNIKDVHVEDSILKTDHRFIHVHDYRQNPNGSSQQICTNSSDPAAEPTWQETSPGIFMAIEAEELKSPELGSRSRAQSTIESALTNAGFHVIESTNDHMTDNVFVTLMDEGYVTIRLYKEAKYVAFDTLLWSSFNSHEALKKLLVESVGGTIEATSSFRIVTGGMFGTKTWKEDRKSHGPEIVNKCPQAEEKHFVKPANNFPIALEGSMDLVQEEEPFTVGVFCAAEGLPCESIDLLANHPRVGSLLTFYACPESESSKDDKILICSLGNAAKTIDTYLSFSDSKNIRAIVVDPGCPPSMEEVPMVMKQKDIFDTNVLAMATIGSRKDLWRRQLVDRMRRKVVPMDPVFRAHAIFNSTSDDSNSSMELAITSSGDELFIEHLKEVVAIMQDKTGLDVQVRNVLGGIWRQETRWVFPDEEASKLFRPEDYDHSSAMDQYLGQSPLGVQAVVQLHNLAPLEMDEEVEYTLYMEGNDEAFKSNVKAIHDDGSYTVYDYFGDDLVLPRFRLTSLSRNGVSNLTALEIHQVFSSVFVEDANEVEDPMYTNTYEGIGEGIVFVAIWENGQAILVWDGRHTLDLNIYCEKLETFQVIQTRIQGELPSLEIHLLDVHPRGYGQVVNFATDLEDLPTPHWFDDVEDEQEDSP